MVKIMQENGEVVVVLGSSANYHNIQTFLTADASLSVEPLYPQVLIFLLLF
jgi:coenzyme F420-reducing hydrogenase gamma subunit